MEEDIKILKEFTESSCCLASQEEIIECVKNLIKGYRELEKEIEILREYIIIAPNLDEMTALKYAHIQESAYFRGRAEEQQRANETIHKHFIPKSKIKEKIEELESKIKATFCKYMTEEDYYNNKFLSSDVAEDYEVLEVRKLISNRNLLQELMEDK